MPKSTTSTKTSTTTTKIEPKASAKSTDKTSNEVAGLQFVNEGVTHASAPNVKLWSATLTDGGHTIEITGKSREQVEDRARAILA
jgi:hypothetical protein